MGKEISISERAAMHGDPMPTGISWRGIAEYIAFRALYWAHKHDVITRDAASELKQQLLAALDGAEASYEFDLRCWNTAAKRYKETEAAQTAYRLNRTLENADKLAAVIDGLKVEEHTDEK